ncbi:MAG: OsmC family protein [Bacteroidetes bacterium]|nr:OsmC family protein [Bacteroidota bacterium]
METIRTTYLGDLRTRATHVQSSEELLTDAPVDNLGKGEYFSPTDLVATALTSCMLTIMGQLANQYDFNIDGTKAKTTKVMASNPRRIGEIIIELDFPAIPYTDKEKKLIEQAAKICPVAQSLHPDTKQTIIFNFHS